MVVTQTVRGRKSEGMIARKGGRDGERGRHMVRVI